MIPESMDGKALAAISYGKWDNLFEAKQTAENYEKRFKEMEKHFNKVQPNSAPIMNASDTASDKGKRPKIDEITPRPILIDEPEQMETNETYQPPTSNKEDVMLDNEHSWLVGKDNVRRKETRHVNFVDKRKRENTDSEPRIKFI